MTSFTMPNPPPIMECGHAANSLLTVHTPDGAEGRIPACVICSGLVGDKHKVIADPQPDLEGRRARCAYFGKKGRHNESNYGCRRKDECDCEEETKPGLPFLELQPKQDFDRFYCGCWGWD